MNSTSPTLLSSLEGNAKYVLDLASYVSITVSILGMALSLVLICSISRAKWRAKRCPTPASHASYIDNTLLAVLYVITLYSVLVLVQNIVWIVDLLSLDQTWVLALLTYALMFALFVCNVRLAFERQSMVQSAHIPDVSSRSLFSLRKGSLGVNLLIYGAPIAFFILQIASFIICTSQNWLLSPFTTPNTPNMLPKILFIVAMMYFPLASIGTLILYAHAYRLAIQSFESYPPSAVSDPEQSSTLDNLRIANHRPMINRGLKLAVLLRCTLMSLGLMVFYIPTIICVFYRLLNGTDGNQYPSDNVWIYFWLNVLPALDCLWTPCLILWFQDSYREDFFVWMSEWADIVVAKIVR